MSARELLRFRSHKYSQDEKAKACDASAKEVKRKEGELIRQFFSLLS